MGKGGADVIGELPDSPAEGAAAPAGYDPEIGEAFVEGKVDAGGSGDGEAVAAGEWEAGEALENCVLVPASNRTAK